MNSNGDVKMKEFRKGQKIFCAEHGKQEIEAVDHFGTKIEYILVCGDIIPSPGFSGL
jgi:hypothetical protein